jgi:hypothetical protein
MSCIREKQKKTVAYGYNEVKKMRTVTAQVARPIPKLPFVIRSVVTVG